MIWLVLYVATIFLANWALSTFGVVPVDGGLFGIMAPAGVLFAGAAFTFRDLTQDALGRRWTAGAIIAGALCSALVSPQLALASGLAFLVSETADFIVYTPIRERNWLLAVALSNTVGLLFDSVLFLWLAFGNLDFLVGQVWGKVSMTILAVLILSLLRGRRAVSVGSA